MIGRIAVVDASVFAEFLFREEQHDRAQELLDGRVLVAPSLLTYELANVARSKVQRGLVEVAVAAHALSVFERMRIRLEHVPISECWRFGVETGVSAYDGSYLALATELGVGLLTFDARLNSAWTALRGAG